MKSRKIYHIIDDPYYVREVVNGDSVQPNDCCVSDAEILSGRIAPNYHGTFTKFEDGLHPLHARGVDFTQVGDILASIDSQEEKTTQKIARRRKEISEQKDDKGASESSSVE